MGVESSIAILHRGQVSKAINDVCVEIDEAVARMTSLVNHLTNMAHEAEAKAVETRRICDQAKHYARRTERSVQDISNMFRNVPRLHSAANAVNANARKVLRGDWTLAEWLHSSAITLVRCTYR